MNKKMNLVWMMNNTFFTNITTKNCKLLNREKI